jgi:hypothetical protein
MTTRDLKLRRASATAWILTDAVTGGDVGGIDYLHDADGNHYRPWVFVDGVEQRLGEPLAQLNMAARVVVDAVSG